MNDYLTRLVERTVAREWAIRPLVSPAFVPGATAWSESQADEHPERMEKNGDVVSIAPGFTEVDAEKERRHPPVRNAPVKNPAELLSAPCGILEQQHKYNPVPVEELCSEDDENPSAVPGPLTAGRVASMNMPAQSAAGTTGATQGPATAPSALMPDIPGHPYTEAENVGGRIFETASQSLHRRQAQQDRELLMEGWNPPVSHERDGEPAGRPADIGQAWSSMPFMGSVARPIPAHERLSVKATTEKERPAPAPEPKPPTVKVSIGRVEIYAAVPQAMTVEPRLPSVPKVSLDEYLRKQPGRTR